MPTDLVEWRRLRKIREAETGAGPASRRPPFSDLPEHAPRVTVTAVAVPFALWAPAALLLWPVMATLGFLRFLAVRGENRWHPVASPIALVLVVAFVLWALS